MNEPCERYREGGIVILRQIDAHDEEVNLRNREEEFLNEEVDGVTSS